MFDKFEIAIHLSIHWRQNNNSKYHTWSDIATLVNAAAFFKNGRCEGQIKVRCEMFDKFEIAMYLSIHWCQNNDSKYHTWSDIATLVNTAANF